MGEGRPFARWAWRWVLLVLVLSNAAYLFAYLCPPQDQIFMGFLVNNDDHQVYLSLMREGAQGAWLATIRFTPEPHQPALLLPLYLILGKVARFLGLANEFVFHLARALGGVLLLIAAYWLGTRCLPPGVVRQSAFLMVCFSSGLGWLLVLAGLADRVIVPVDIRVPESSTFLTLMTSPHFVLGIALQLLTFILYLGAGRRPGYLLGAALCLLLLSITLVYNVIVVAVALGGYALIRCWQQRSIWRPELWHLAAVGAPAVPIVLYYYVLFRFVPFWRVVYGEQDVVRTPGWLALLLGYGLALGLALWGLALWARRGEWSQPRILLAAWVVSNGLLLYAPLAFQGKLATGWHVGLCTLAAVGLHEGLLPCLRRGWVGDALTRRRQDLLSTIRNVVLILTVPSTLIVALLGFRIALAEHGIPYFLPVEDAQAVAWLEVHADNGDVVLASYGISNYLAAHSDARSYLGHPFAAIDPRGKDQAVRCFYSSLALDEERRAIVDAHGITLVYYGTHERALDGRGHLPGRGAADASLLDRVPWLAPVYRQGAVTIYAVRGEGWQDSSAGLASQGSRLRNG